MGAAKYLERSPDQAAAKLQERRTRGGQGGEAQGPRFRLRCECSLVPTELLILVDNNCATDRSEA